MENLFLRVCVLQLVLTSPAAAVTSTSDAPELVSATVGQDCELPCAGPQGELLILEWTISDRHLLFYRDGRALTRAQDQRFRNRVELSPEEKMKSGVFTVTLKNVSLEDAGTFTCLGLVQTSDKRQSFSRTVQLSVSEGKEVDPVYEPQVDVRVEQVKSSSPRAAEGGVTEDGAGGSLAPVLGGAIVGVIVMIGVVIGAVVLVRKKNPLKRRSQSESSDDSPPTTPTTPDPCDSSALIPPASGRNPLV